MGRSKSKYISYMERLIRITHAEPFDHEVYKELITEICEDYKIAKGVTEFYNTPMMEQRAQGDYYCDYDNGKGEKVLTRIRIMSSTKAIIIGTLYVEPKNYDRDDEELQELEMLFRVILGFVSRVRLLKKLEELGFYDLDGYRNFRAFARYLDITNSENKLGGCVAFHVDLRNFTAVNQEIGRENGDRVLRNYYKMLEDAMEGKGIIARLGGDKFVGIFDRRMKRAVFDIFAGVAVPYEEKGGRRIKVTAAVGVYMLSNPYVMRGMGDIMDKMMLAANIAKRQTAGNIVVYDDKMKASKDHVKKVLTDFHSALEKGEFQVYYQPKVDVRTRTIVGTEALCRWVKNKKVIPPIEFIPILEMGMDICDLDFYMLERVCENIKAWLDAGNSAVCASVNLSRKHLVDVDLLEHIVSIIDKHGVPHECIEIELTETTTDVQFSDLKNIVCGLHDQGIRTAIDDFGVGYSSLNLIGDLPWTVLKIDKSFVPKNVEEAENTNGKMFRHVVSLAKDLGLEIVVEGVETVDQLEVLKNNGCEVAQGYFFDRPLPQLEFEERLHSGPYPETL